MLRRALGAATVLCLLAAGFVLAIAPHPRLPEPTGPYAIGTTTRAWTDPSRPEPFTVDPDDHRSLIAQIWYPADPAPGAPTAPYMDPAAASALSDLLHVPSPLLARTPGARTHAVPQAPPARGRHPVLVRLSGHSGFRGEAQAWVEELVSHGYVVIGLDQPGTAVRAELPDGRNLGAIPPAQLRPLMPEALVDGGPAPSLNGVDLPGGIVPFLAQDASLALDRALTLNTQDELLAGHLETAQVGVFGLSLGGYTAPEACRRDVRFRACLEADAGQTAEVAAEGIRQPLMIMTREASSMRRERDRAGGWPEEEIAATLASQRSLFEISTGPSWYLTANDLHHLNWTDLPLWSPLFRWTGLAGPIAPVRSAALVSSWSLAFFDRTLKGEAAPLLDGASPAWPEVQVQKHG